MQKKVSDGDGRKQTCIFRKKNIWKGVFTPSLCGIAEIKINLGLDIFSTIQFDTANPDKPEVVRFMGYPEAAESYLIYSSAGLISCN